MFVGIDIGSTTSKAVILDDVPINEKGEEIAFSIIPTSYDLNQSGEEVLKLALKKIGKPASGIKRIVSTGYGRRSFKRANKPVPEIICHAEGTKPLFPEAKTVIDIGGQDSKVIALDDDGNVIRFEMNDKCAAGTGRFLDVLATRILKISIEELGPISLKSRDPCILSSTCTVFAESEIISYLAKGRSLPDIVAGLHIAIAKRVTNMGFGGQISYKEDIVFSGGVAKNIGVVKAIEEVLGKQVMVPEESQITAALGAALIARC